MLRQGDVLILIQETLPPGSCLEPSPGGVVLAYGETTGHAHRVAAPDAQLYRSPDGATYLVLASGGEVQHEEHGVLVLSPGTYSVIRQREYSSEAIRNVAD